VVVGASLSVITVDGLSAFVSVGDVVSVDCEPPSLGEVISVDSELSRVRLVDEGARVPIKTRVSVRPGLTVRPCLDWCGRVVDYLGSPIDGKGPLLQGPTPMGVNDPPSNVISRARVLSPVATGVHAIDVFTPLCVGQRLGVFAGSGVGKTTLLSMIARTGKFDRVVLGLVGERGREVREFIEDVLGSGFSRAVVVASTGDESAMRRRLSAHTAMATAKRFRSEGCSVLLILDSLTRYAQAVRDIALSAGELPVSRGYPVKVLQELAKLLEHAGPGIDGEGSITAVFSILIEGDDHNDPIADVVRGILDGHIVLDRTIANRGLYPAIDIRSSISRLARHAWTADDAIAVKELLRLVSVYEDSRDIRSLGGYTAGRDQDIDLALRIVPALYNELTQSPSLMVEKNNTFCTAASLLASLSNRL
jgi:flagellum-specific ATP synthase